MLKTIEDRFTNELEEISRYASLVLDKFERITWQDIEKNLIHINEIKLFCDSKKDNLSDEMSPDELHEILKIIKDVYLIQKKLYDDYFELNNLTKVKYDNSGVQLILELLEFNIIDDFYDIDVLDRANVLKKIVNIKDEFYKIIKENENSFSNTNYLHKQYKQLNDFELDELYNRLTDYIRMSVGSEQCDIIGWGIDFMYDLDNLFKIIDNNSQTNVYKQSFILSMANFDAVIFDITEIFLDKHFFDYITHFKPKSNETKIDFGKFEKFNNFDEMKKTVISDILTSMYAKSIIHKINNTNGIKLMNSNELDKIIEMFERRNIHLHNKGIVDDKYIKGWCPCDLEIGDYAIINKNYYEESKTIMKDYINKYCIWIKSLECIS